MADAIISAVTERLTTTVVGQIQNAVNLLRGVKKEVLNLFDELRGITNVLDDAERRGFKEKSVKNWLKRLEDTCYEMDDVLDKWEFCLLKHQMEQSNTAAIAPKKKVCSFIPSSWCLCFKKVATRHNFSKKIRQVRLKLDQILKEKDQHSFVVGQPTDPFGGVERVPSTSFVDVEDIHGRDDDKETLLSKIFDEGASQEQSGIQIFSIIGLGGIGKTTLAQLIYNDSRVKERYSLRIWICVSKPFDVAGIAKGIAQKAQPKWNSLDTNQLDLLLEHLSSCIMGQKFFLVLDDVWTEDDTKWEPLKNCLKSGEVGSKILVTTRKEKVAIVMGTKENEMCHLEVLSNDDCWLLLSRIALCGRNENECERFEGIGKEIAKKCRGLPLAAKTLGSMLRFKYREEEWQNILESELWKLKEAEEELFPHLLLSYNELSPTLKRCFSYCAIFPKGSSIDVEDLIRNWMAVGYLGTNGSVRDLEVRGREYFDNLAMRSLFQEFQWDEFNEHVVSNCKMHDIVHDFAQFLRKDTRNDTVETTCRVCGSSLVSHVKEYRSIFCDEEPPPYICDCLTSLRVLRLGYCRLGSIIEGIGKLIHLRHLDLSYSEELSEEGLKTICKLYKLMTLLLPHCDLQEIPKELGYLICLRHLNLSGNSFVELPESICNLRELQSLDVEGCGNLRRLPQGIHKLINLKHLHNYSTDFENDQFLGQLTSLRSLDQFRGKLSFLKKSNQLSGYLNLIISNLSGEEDVVEAQEAEMNKKVGIKRLGMDFVVNAEKEIDEWVWMDVIDALKPHPNLVGLSIVNYGGSKLPDWITSPFNHVREIYLKDCDCLLSLPPLGTLPFLEELLMSGMSGLQHVGRELLGIIATPVVEDRDAGYSSSSTVDAAAATTTTIAIGGFPMLKTLRFEYCPSWKVWEDITAEEEDSTTLCLMPRLQRLKVFFCEGLMELPHRLLRKASSLVELDIGESDQLVQHYDPDNEEEGSAWNSISHIPRVLPYTYT